MPPGRATPADAALDRLALADRLLVGCDFDGTLAPIVADPGSARPLPGGVAALTALAAMPQTHVAIISGRARTDLLRLVGQPPGIVIIGGHGAEWGGDLSAELSAEQAHALREVALALAGIADGVPGVLVERKPGSVAIHVRNADRRDAEQVLLAVQQGPARIAGVTTIAGKEVLELCVVEATKGTAVSRLREQFAPTVAAYFGDDTTDEDAFVQLGDQDAGFKVGPGASRARIRLPDPPAVVAVLMDLAHRRGVHFGSRDR